MVYGRALPGHTAGSHVYDQALYDLASETTYHRMFGPTLNMTLTSDPTPGSNVEGGQVITYTIEITNTGERDAIDVLLRDTFPSFMSFVDGSQQTDALGAVFQRFGNMATWIIPQLQIGETLTFSFQARVSDMSDIGSRTLNDSAEVAETTVNGDPQTELLAGNNFQKANRVMHFQFRGATLVVYKVDSANGEPLEGAEFALRALKVADPQQQFDEWYATTDDEGNAYFTDVPIGRYEVYETEAPEGYRRNLIRRSVNIDGSKNELEVTFSNTRGLEILDELVPNAGLASRNEGDCPQ
jgi:uncharacterized repeat protein (TIGR01451 family)